MFDVGTFAATSVGTLAFGSLSLTLNALRAHETMSGNEPARISDAASAAVESDLRRATTSEGRGSGIGRILKKHRCERLTLSSRTGYGCVGGAAVLVTFRWPCRRPTASRGSPSRYAIALFSSRGMHNSLFTPPHQRANTAEFQLSNGKLPESTRAV